MSFFKNNILNCKQKDLNKINFNYFYITTFIFIGVICLCFFVLSQQISNLISKSIYLEMVFNVFRHNSVGQLIFNLVFFLLVSLFLERHFGSLQYFFLILFGIPLSAIAISFISKGANLIGISGLNYFLFSIMIIEVVFGFKSYLFSKWQFVFTLIILGLVLFIMCISGNPDLLLSEPIKFFRFGIFTNLISNSSHYFCMIMGGLIGFISHSMLFKKRVD